MTPEQIASLSPEDRRALLEALQMQGIGAPEDPNLEAAATPITPDPEVAAPKKRALTPYEEELRLRSMARRAGVTAAAAEQMLVADAGNDFEKFKPLRRAGNDRRDAELARREQEVVKTAQLRRNPMAYIGRDDITEEQRRLVSEAMPINPYYAQMRMGAGENDARIAVANIQAQAQRDAAAAEAGGRREAMQFQTNAETEREKMRIAAEERARLAGVEDRNARQDFEREQNDLNRQAAASQGDSRAMEGLAKLQADLDARRLEQEERMQQFMAGQEEAQRRFELQMEAQRAEREENRARWAAQDAASAAARAQEQQKIDAQLDLQRKREELAAKEAVLAPLRAIHPGVDNLASGDYDSPSAQQALQALAKDSDESWFGFNADDALRMDAVLFRLGIENPAVRQRLIAQHGLAPGVGVTTKGGGRGSFMSGLGQYFYGPPSYPTRTKGADGTVPTL